MHPSINKIIDKLLSHNLLDMAHKKIYERQIDEYFNSRNDINVPALESMDLSSCDCKKDGIDPLFARIDAALRNVSPIKVIYSEVNTDYNSLPFERKEAIETAHFKNWLELNDENKKMWICQNKDNVHQFAPVLTYQISRFRLLNPISDSDYQLAGSLPTIGKYSPQNMPEDSYEKKEFMRKEFADMSDVAKKDKVLSWLSCGCTYTNMPKYINEFIDNSSIKVKNELMELYDQFSHLPSRRTNNNLAKKVFVA